MTRVAAAGVPEWVQDAVFYQVFPDRFARSDRVAKPSLLERWDDPPTIHGYKGGDLLGVVERLDHLQDLGVTALYLNPVFQSGANHRYHTHDYLRVDPLLGGDAALRELLDACHGVGMRVVLDGVFNHASRGFLQFHDVLENGLASPYLDWWHVHGFPLGAYGEGDGERRYDAWWDLPALPKFNTDTPAVRAFLLEVAEHWLRFGIDGWRLDVPSEIDDDEFWREFRTRCRAVNPECYIVGEIWGDGSRWLQGDQFDAVMNYELTRAVLGFAAEEVDEREVARCGLHRLGDRDAAAFARAVEDLVGRYAPEIVRAQLNLLGSHDTPRVRTMLRGDRDGMLLAMVAMFTLPGVPCVYYGDELGLEGDQDPGCRQAMPWDRAAAWDETVLGAVRALARARHDHPALRSGSLSMLHARGRLAAYRRHTGADDVVAMLNAGTAAAQLALDLPGREREPRVLLGAGSLVRHAGGIEAELPPRSALVVSV